MKILMVSSEYAPVAKTGGLADAVAGLSGALRARGHDVRILLPKYSHLHETEPIPGERGQLRFFAMRTEPESAPIYLVELSGPIEERIYAGDERDALRFLQLSVAALHLPRATDWRPDVFHCHDWQTAMVAALPGSREIAPTVLTVHNMGHQGAYAARVFADNRYADVAPFIDKRARRARAVNYLRAGLNAAAAITTVSPTYAKEIRTAPLGMGLEGLLGRRAHDLTGILNGVDYAVWSPGCDALLPERFDASDLAPKRRLKAALCRRLGLADHAPLVASLSRLDPQKGIDLLVSALPRLLRDTRASFVIHGRGREKLAAKLQRIAERRPNRVSFTNGYDETFAHEILAASDCLVVPSRYEPCGLTPLYAMRYGTVPVVRATGGMTDSVVSFDPITRRGTGSVFVGYSGAELRRALQRALHWFEDASVWSGVVENAMRANFSWDNPAEQYESIYSRLALR